MKKIATIARSTADSPNMTANDAAILECITAELQQRGAKVTCIGEDEEIPNDTHVVCTMSRTAGIIERLRQAEANGITVINTTAAVKNCSRKRFMEILHRNAIPQPPYHIVNCTKLFGKGGLAASGTAYNDDSFHCVLHLEFLSFAISLFDITHFCFI